MFSTVLMQIIVAAVLGGILSIVISAFFAFSAKPNWIPILISYAVGALLGATFLDLLSEALELSKDKDQILLVTLLGILVFFLLEKLVLWRHNHIDLEHQLQPDVCQHDVGHVHSSGIMVLVGDSVHNFVDGVVIAGAFLVSPEVGISTAIAIIAHEIPQEVGDFLVLLYAGFGKKKAFFFNMLSSLSMLFGAIVAYFALRSSQELLPFLLALAASSMIYVAVADLIPSLHRRNTLQASIAQVILIFLGILTIFVTHSMTHV